MSSLRWIVAVFACALLPGAAARGDMIQYFDCYDAGAGPGSTLTHSGAAAAAFATAAGTPLESFQFPPPTTVSPALASSTFPLNSGDGASISLTSSGLDPSPPAGYEFGYTTSSNSDVVENNQWLGFNILNETSHYEVAPLLSARVTTLTIASTSGAPFDGFGFYLTGFGDVSATTLSVEFTDASGTHSEQVTGSTQGGALFFGAIDPGAGFTQFQLVINNSDSGDSRDVFSINSIQFATVPEPSSWALLALGGLAAFAIRRRRG